MRHALIIKWSVAVPVVDTLSLASNKMLLLLAVACCRLPNIGQWKMTKCILAMPRATAFYFTPLLKAHVRLVLAPPPRHAQFNNVKDMMADDTMNTRFGEWVEKCLCGESFWFLNEVSKTTKKRACVGFKCALLLQCVKPR